MQYLKVGSAEIVTMGSVQLDGVTPVLMDSCTKSRFCINLQISRLNLNGANARVVKIIDDEQNVFLTANEDSTSEFYFGKIYDENLTPYTDLDAIITPLETLLDS